VDGRSAIDDAPQAGHNATVLLGHLARHLAATVECGQGGRMCIAGLHTGDRHNRVYGTGELLVNLAYRDAAEGRRLEAEFTHAVAGGLARFEDEFAGTPTFGLTAKEATAITRLDWLKRGLPTLDGCDPWAERLFDRAGFTPWPADVPPFSCDAIWMSGVADAFTVVCGPGDLVANRAHADGEHVDLADLDRFAAGIGALLASLAQEGLPCS
jgi:acetylornithine deacetylase/succinyl-diaminopimelate desuccinylase-like protein